MAKKTAAKKGSSRTEYVWVLTNSKDGIPEVHASFNGVLGGLLVSIDACRGLDDSEGCEIVSRFKAPDGKPLDTNMTYADGEVVYGIQRCRVFK